MWLRNSFKCSPHITVIGLFIEDEGINENGRLKR